MTTATAIAQTKPIHPGQAMTLPELLEYCRVRCVYTQRKWVARGWTPGWAAPRGIGAIGDSPMAAVMGLLKRMGGA